MKGMLFALLFLLAGGALDLYSADHLYLALSSRGWPTADGTMGASEIETTRSRRAATYNARVTYTYTVDGKLYTGTQVSFGNEGTGDRLEAQSIIERFPRGAAVKVHYDPKDPATASLIVGIETWRDFVPLVIGLVLTGVGGYALAQIFRDRARKKRAPRKPLRT